MLDSDMHDLADHVDESLGADEIAVTSARSSPGDELALATMVTG